MRKYNKNNVSTVYKIYWNSYSNLIETDDNKSEVEEFMIVLKPQMLQIIIIYYKGYVQDYEIPDSVRLVRMARVNARSIHLDYILKQRSISHAQINQASNRYIIIHDIHRAVLPHASPPPQMIIHASMYIRFASALMFADIIRAVCRVRVSVWVSVHRGWCDVYIQSRCAKFGDLHPTTHPSLCVRRNSFSTNMRASECRHIRRALK